MSLSDQTHSDIVGCIIWIKSSATIGAPRGFGDLVRMAIYFQGAGSTSNFLRGAREQAHNCGDLGSLAKKQKQLGKSLHFV